MALDYCFLRDADTTNLLTVLVAYVKPWRLYYAFPVETKGADMPAIELLSRRLQDTTLTTFACRSDKEPAIRSLMNEAAKMSRTQGRDATDDVHSDLLPDEDSDAEPTTDKTTTKADRHEPPPLPPPESKPDHDKRSSDYHKQQKRHTCQRSQRRDAVFQKR